ncbi:MAG: phage portal protein [Lachnospiraceae bacterium]|nr:phage portal protein [Lachnospiraceae bacterium]
MSFIESFIAFISPSWAYKREIYRQGYDELRNYDAGNYEKTNQNWRVQNLPAELTDKGSRDNVRARARDLERNSDMMNAVIGAFKRNVVGGGYRMQATTGQPELNKQIEQAWKKWCKKQNCDVTGQQSFNQIIRMAVERKKVDGGILFVKRYTKGAYLPFQLQMIEVDELDNMQTTPKQAGNKVAGGIEYNSYNKPQGYYIRQYGIDGYSLMDPVYIEAEDVIFYFSKKRPTQLREISDMAPTIPRIRDANEFMVAVSVKERIAACLSVFIKKVLPTTGIGRTGNTASDQRNSYEGKTITPGMIKELNAGDEIQVVNPSGQSADATAFTKLQQRLIGAGQGISYEATSRDMSESNYSSTRQGLIEDELTYKEDKELLIEIMTEIYETFLISAVLAGVISIPDFWNNKDIYMGHEWIQAPKAWIDPAKESNATKTALASGQKTFKQIAAENGRDWREQIDDMVEVLEYGKTKGIDLGGVIFEQASQKSGSESSESAVEEDDDETDGNK